MKIHESAENYLETILLLGERQPLEFSKPSVSVAMKNLRLNGYIQVDGDGFITLTQAGREIAEMIYERHRLISSLLIQLGVDPDVAVEDACRIEHVISEESFEAVKRYITENHLLKVF